MSSASEFGKDLGLLHEAVITGRKAGATPDDWAKLAHDENVWSAVLGVLRDTKAGPAGFFRRLGLTAVIPTTTGKRTIAGAKKTFSGYIDPDFKNWGLDVLGEVKPEMPVESVELAKSSTFMEFFGSFGVSLDKLVVTDDQIIWVVENRPGILSRGGNANYFLKKEGDKFFVVYVRRIPGGLGVYVLPLSHGCVWDAEYRHRVVVPQR